MRVRDLAQHPEPYVTVAELAAYWLVGRKQIYKHIDAGQLTAIRLGPRLLRIRTADALAFERRTNVRRASKPAKPKPPKPPVKAPLARRRATRK